MIVQGNRETRSRRTTVVVLVQDTFRSRLQVDGDTALGSQAVSRREITEKASVREWQFR